MCRGSGGGCRVCRLLRRRSRPPCRLLRRRSGPAIRVRLRLGRPSAVRVRSRLRLRRRSWRGVRMRVCGPAARARSAGAPARVVAVERLPHQPADELPHRHARVHVRQQARKLLQAALTLRVDERLQFVAAVAERAHAIGRRRQFRVQVGQHLLDLPRALAGRLLDQLLPPDCIQHQRRLGGQRRYGRRGTRRRCRSNAHCNSAAALSDSEPSRSRSRVCGLSAHAHGSNAPPGGRVAVAQFAHGVLAGWQRTGCGPQFRQMVAPCSRSTRAVAGLRQQLTVGQGGDGAGSRRAWRRWRCALHAVNILPVSASCSRRVGNY